eukprot:scaffold31815_cov118-Isochrysis_galbana.AAC.9
MPRNTPTQLPSSTVRVRPVPCSASYPASSSSRCCGSIADDSAGDRLKRRASKPSTPLKKAPYIAEFLCASLSASSSRSCPSYDHRGCARSKLTASPDESSMDQRATVPRSASRPPPEGPRAAAAALTGTRSPGTPGDTSSRLTRCLARARGVGWSNRSAALISTPVFWRSRMDNSLAPSESIPESISGVDGSMSAEPPRSRTQPSTSASTCPSRASGRISANSSANGLRPSALGAVVVAGPNGAPAGSSASAGRSAMCCTRTMSAARPCIGEKTTGSHGKAGSCRGSWRESWPSTDARHSAYSSSSIVTTWRTFLPRAPMPAPAIRGSCMLRAGSPPPARPSASESMQALADA